jgi:hypothetical protein
MRKILAATLIASILGATGALAQAGDEGMRESANGRHHHHGANYDGLRGHGYHHHHHHHHDHHHVEHMEHQ